MKKRILTVALIVWIAAIFCIMQFVLLASESSERTGAYLDGYVSDGISYAIDQRSSGSFAYKIKGNGKIEAMLGTDILGFTRFDAIRQGDEGPAVVASKAEGGSQSEKRIFRIYLLDSSLKPVKVSSLFSLPGGIEFSSISEEAGDYYIGAVEDNGSGAFIYSIPASAIKDYSTDEEEAPSVTPTKIFEKRSTDGSVFLKAVYRGGVLNIQTDREEPTELTMPDASAKAAYESAKIGFIGRMRSFLPTTILFLSFLIGGTIIFIALIILCTKHPFVSLSIACISGVAVLLTVMGAAQYLSTSGETKQTTMSFTAGYLKAIGEDIKDTGFALIEREKLYEDAAYENLKDILDVSLSDVLVVDSKTLEVVASKSGMNHLTCEEIYGSDFSKYCEEAADAGQGYGVATIKGERFSVFAVSMKEEYNIPYTLVGVYRLDNVSLKDMIPVWIFLACILLAFSTVFVIRIVLEHREIRRLADSMAEVSKGSGDEITLPKNRSYRVARLWEALGEIADMVRRINYTAYQVYEAYFRFAPKKIETILEKPSIAEVEVGDAAEFNGTEAVLTITDESMSILDNISDINELLSIMEKYQEKIGGVLVSSDLSVGLVKLVFKEKKKVLSFGIDFCHETESRWQERSKAAMVLHFGRFRYGVAGTMHQSMAFLHSEESALLEKYAAWFRKLGLSLCITESTKEHEGITDGLRYVGFISEGAIKLTIYEVLDANPERVRAGKIDNLEKYNKAIESFKALDFYLARNLFSEILRDVPEDALAKWYLFESERLLNQGPGGELLRLHMD